jgi:hypothetical protein
MALISNQVLILSANPLAPFSAHITNTVRDVADLIRQIEKEIEEDEEKKQFNNKAL